ncbi:MAG: 23S rRNA (uracil1939-C5)-methyltransferase [Granulosicoccus sp.]|jgi:23S rRNA (uracil1939-C5)-methyltransferase
MKDKTGWNKYRHKRNPVEPKEAELTIESLTNSGDGLGRLDDRVVFVPYTMPGDKVQIKITQRKKNFMLAETIDILEEGPGRVTPRCSVFERCGGCDWQHVPYAHQLKAKEEQLRDTLTRIGTLGTVPIEPIAHGGEEFNYRNRIQGEVRGGKFHYKRRRSDERIAIDRCEIAEEPINEWLASDLSEVPAGRVEIAIVDRLVVVAPISEKNTTDLGFRQVNTQVSQLLTNRLLECVKNSECTTVIDLYCGRGNWTNQIAALHTDKQVMGVDTSSENIDAARANSRQMKLGNVQFHLSPVEKIINRLPVATSLCIVDPPRSGLDSAVTERLCRNRPPELIYVSCHPATLARDLKLLTNAGYQITTLLPLDMFPQTAHLESFVHLKIK